MTFQTPGVYVQEIPSLPPGVAEIKSAIPAFLGYTELIKYNGLEIKYKPIKIQSMLEYRVIFGGAPDYKIEGVELDLKETEKKATVEPKKYMYDALQLYFMNGGGPCYIVSLGLHETTFVLDDYTTAFDELDLYDEPTLYVMPDLVAHNVPSDIASTQQMSLARCKNLQDRFAILDVPKNADNTPGNNFKYIDTYRDKIGMSYLNYGAAYTPWVKTNLSKDIKAESIEKIFETLEKLDKSILDFKVIFNSKEITISDLITDYKKINLDFSTLKTEIDVFLKSNNFEKQLEDDIALIVIDADLGPFQPKVEPVNAQGAEPAVQGIEAGILNKITSITDGNNNLFKEFWKINISDFIGKNNNEGLFKKFSAENTAVKKKEFLKEILDSGKFDFLADLNFFMKTGLSPIIYSYEKILIENIPYYASLLKILNSKLSELPPSAIMAGLYCRTDSDRGVWKSPANISLSGVSEVSQLFTAADLDSLNVDATAGKSINVIRPITGKGIMVMGARTLDGNSSEWRYIAVRRLFIFIEENLKKSSAWAVFEPNDKMLWTTIKAQIDNYLFELWRQGALAGAKPEDAYRVYVGLNSTMTPQDILEGRLNIEIKLAAVRPAEFIILKFSHQLQKS